MEVDSFLDIDSLLEDIEEYSTKAKSLIEKIHSYSVGIQSEYHILEQRVLELEAKLETAKLDNIKLDKDHEDLAVAVMNSWEAQWNDGFYTGYFVAKNGNPKWKH